MNQKDFFVPDEPDGAGARGRPSGLAFLPHGDDDYTSMYIKGLVSPEELLADCPRLCPGCGLCEIQVAHFLELQLPVRYVPEWGYGHVGVWGLDSSKPGVKQRRKIAFRSIVHLKPALYR